MGKRLILLREERHPNGLHVRAYLNELTHHTYAIGYFPKEKGWMILDSGVVPTGGQPHTPTPIEIPGKPGHCYGIFSTHVEALARLEQYDTTLNEPIIGQHRSGFRPRRASDISWN